MAGRSPLRGSGLRPVGAEPAAQSQAEPLVPNADGDFDRLMDATQTLIQLKVGDVLTQEMIDDLNLVDQDHRESFERATDAFHKGYQAGLERGGGADVARLVEERDEARDAAMIARALLKHSIKEEK